MAADLLVLLSLEPGCTDALEEFIGSCLCDGGIWDSPRTSDGIRGIERVLEREPGRLRVCGRIWEIDQTLHAFWLELARDGESDRFAWSLYFEVAERSTRRARSALDSHDRAEDLEWRARLAGEAIAQDGTLAIVPGSTQVVIRDMPELGPLEETRGRRRRRRV